MENESHPFNVYSVYFCHETNLKKKILFFNSRDQGNSRHCVLTSVLYLSVYRDKVFLNFRIVEYTIRCVNSILLKVERVIKNTLQIANSDFLKVKIIISRKFS